MLAWGVADVQRARGGVWQVSTLRAGAGTKSLEVSQFGPGPPKASVISAVSLLAPSGVGQIFGIPWMPPNSTSGLLRGQNTRCSYNLDVFQDLTTGHLAHAIARKVHLLI